MRVGHTILKLLQRDIQGIKVCWAIFQETINKSNKGSLKRTCVCSSNSMTGCSCNLSHADQSITSKTIDDKRYYPKPLVNSKKKQKMYYYKKHKLSRDENELLSYIQSNNTKKKESGEYSIKQNNTLDSVEISKTAKQRCSVKSKKGLHKKADSLCSVSFQKPKISSTICSSFVSQKGLHNKTDYSSSINLKHQRRSSETQFSNQTSVKYEPLQKYKNLEKPSPKSKPSSKANSRTFYLASKDISSKVSKEVNNHKSFVGKEANLIPTSILNVQKSACKAKKVKPTICK